MRGKGRTALELAVRWVRSYGVNDRKTLAELADEFGVTPARMRTIVRTARPLLARKGLVSTVPIRDDGFVYVLTDKVAIVARRVLHRMAPILTEVIRHDEDIRVVNQGNSPFTDLIEALLDVTAELDEMTEDELPA